MSTFAHPRCVPCTASLFRELTRTKWVEQGLISSLEDGDGPLDLLGQVIRDECSINFFAFSYVGDDREFIGDFPSMAHAKEAVEQRVVMGGIEI